MDSNLSANNANSPAGSEQKDQPDRRSALAAGSSLLMAAGLVGGYGTFFAMAGRYLFPSGADKAWMFVANAKGVQAGQSIDFESPAGVQVTITRKADSTEEAPTAESFLALSSVCPHLGCRVHWEGHNDRFFCPCHNGVFDPSGKAVSGPPASDGQDLPGYPLQVKDGALYIEMPYRSV
jgi:Rieske Fe-S protein